MARRRLRLIERPAPPAAGQLSSFAFGAGAIAAFALLVMWIQPVTTRGHDCPRCLQYFQASLPAFRLAAIPIVWLWCWAGVTRACGAHYINYRFLLEVSLEEEAGWHWNAAIAAVLTAGWLVIFALFTACVRFGIDPLVPGSDLSPAYYPLGLLVFVILILTFPPSTIFAVGRTAANKSPDWSSDSSDSSDSFAAKMRRVMRIFNPRARASLLRSIAHMAIAPFGPPIRFRDNLGRRRGVFHGSMPGGRRHHRAVLLHRRVREAKTVPRGGFGAHEPGDHRDSVLDPTAAVRAALLRQPAGQQGADRARDKRG